MPLGREQQGLRRGVAWPAQGRGLASKGPSRRDAGQLWTLDRAPSEPARNAGSPASHHGGYGTVIILPIANATAQNRGGLSSKGLWHVSSVILSSQSLHFSISLVHLYLGCDCSLSAINTFVLLEAWKEEANSILLC